MTEQFKLSILAGDAPDRPPEQIAPGFDLAEIPNSIHMIPLESDAKWAARKALIQSWKLPPTTISSHWFGGGLVATGPAADKELTTFWIDRSFDRLAEIGVKSVGCYGSHFPVPEGYSRVKATDQAIAYVNLMADAAEKRGMRIALEPMAAADSVFPRYLDGLEFVKRIDRPQVRIMADLNYFLKLDQPLSDIAVDPSYCIHVHIAGAKGQPGIGDMVDTHTRLFQTLKDVGYTDSVTCACPWVSSDSGPMDFARETAKTLTYMQDLRAKVYAA
ncbi:MAG: sugar phosphate isomerase/epimerase family protein [bacterium]